MVLLRLSLVIVFSALTASFAQAQDGGQLAQSIGCMGCHDLTQAKMGPSFSDIAAQYKGQADAAAKLAAKLKNGAGHPKADATDAELQQLIAYVLATP